MHGNPCRENAIGDPRGGETQFNLSYPKQKVCTCITQSFPEVQLYHKLRQVYLFQIQIAVLCGNYVLNFPMFNWSNSTEMIFQKCDLCKRYKEVSVTSLLCSTGILGHHLLQPRCRNKEWAGQYTTNIKAIHSLLIHTTFIDAMEQNKTTCFARPDKRIGNDGGLKLKLFATIVRGGTYLFWYT